MQTYEFDIVLKDYSKISDDHAEGLFDAGCNDGTPVSCNGIAWIHFDREAASLEDAIRTAVSQVQAAGLTVSKVELDPSGLAAPSITQEEWRQFVLATAGSITDPTFMRHPQGEYEKRGWSE